MIYEVYLDDKLLYYPNDETYSVINGIVNMALNEAGSFECDVPSTNPCYESFNLRKSMIRVTKDGEEIFYGEVREVRQNFDFTKHIYAVGELAFLFDSIQPQAKYQTTPVSMFRSLLTYHNSQVEARKQFSVGNVTVVDSNNYIYHYTNREDTLTAIREKMCKTLDGYLRIRKVNGVRYLDMVQLSGYGRYCKQEIAFGENLLDYSANYTSEDVATCVVPLGKRLEDEERTSDAIDGLDEYLTIKGTSTDAYHKRIDDDYVYSQSAVNSFGWVRVVKSWNDITTKDALKQKAINWLTQAQWSKLELELNAVDLNMLDNNIESFDVGDTIHAWAEPYNMDTTFPVRAKTTYLNDLSKNYIVLGNTETQKSYTKQSSDAVNALKEEIPPINSIIEESKSTALSLLLDETQGGYVVYEYEYDAAGRAINVKAINVCNARTIDASTKRWRWSQNGFGFLERASTSVSWGDEVRNLKVALTSDGEINADRITTGLMQATRIHGGTLKLGGSGNGNGVCSVVNASDMEIVKLDVNGITMNGGSIDLNNGTFKVTSAGAVTATNLTLNGGSINLNNKFKVNSEGGVTATNLALNGGSINLNNKFTVDSQGAVNASNLTLSGGTININDNFIVSRTGAVTAKSLELTGGSINLANVFKVSSAGKVTATDLSLNGGSINLNNTFKVNNQGEVTAKNLKISGGSIKLGSAFEVTNAGKVTASDLKLKGGSINLNNKFKVSSEGAVTATSGTVGGFTLGSTNMKRGDSIVSESVIGCGKAGNGIVNIVGNKSTPDKKYGYIQLSNSGSPDECYDGIRIFGNGKVVRYDENENVVWERYLSNIPVS